MKTNYLVFISYGHGAHYNTVADSIKQVIEVLENSCDEISQELLDEVSLKTALLENEKNFYMEFDRGTWVTISRMDTNPTDLSSLSDRETIAIVNALRNYQSEEDREQLNDFAGLDNDGMSDGELDDLIEFINCGGGSKSTPSREEFYILSDNKATVIVNDGVRPEFTLVAGDKIKLRYLFWGHSDKPNFEAVVGDDLEDFILALNTEYKDYEVSKMVVENPMLDCPSHLTYMFEVVKDNRRENSPRENGNYEFVTKQIDVVYNQLCRVHEPDEIFSPDALEAFEKTLNDVKSMKPGDRMTYEWITIRCLYIVY